MGTIEQNSLTPNSRIYETLEFVKLLNYKNKYLLKNNNTIWLLYAENL